jgi:hypothetical protein
MIINYQLFRRKARQGKCVDRVQCPGAPISDANSLASAAYGVYLKLLMYM